MDTSDNLSLPYIMPSQAQKHVTHNEAIGILDGLVQLSVLDRDLATPPAIPGDGSRYIVAGSPTGDWTGQTNAVAHYLDGAWTFHMPRQGFVAYVADEAIFVHWSGSVWKTLSGAVGALQNLALLGIGTTADGTNPFSAKLNKALWTAKTAAEGGDGDLRYTLNKETVTDVVSFLMQTGFSGRAEFGLIGDDSVTLKVSANGSSWTTAIVVDKTSGQVLLPNGSAAAPALAFGSTGTGWRRDQTTGRLSASVDGIEQASLNRGGKLMLRKRMLLRPAIPQRNYVTGATWLISTSAADNSWNNVCWSPELGLFCAVGSTGTGNRVMTSPDGITWTSRTSAADNDWYGLCWSPELGLFVATSITGTGNRVMSSPDGITWTARTPATNNDWRAVCWAPEPGLFCAVSGTGTGNRVMTSPDGITWTSRTSAADYSWRNVCWSPELGLFCAVGSTGTGTRVMTSADGMTWTIRTSAADNDWRGLCWSPELALFVATSTTGTGNRVMTSPDGVTWTARASSSDTNLWQSVCWSPELGLFCAVASGADSGTRLMTSPDAITWTARNSAANNSWVSVAWASGLGLFAGVAVSGTGNRATTSVSMFKYPYRS